VSHNGNNSAGTVRVIGRIGAFTIVAGSMLGIGIFLSPPIVAANTGAAWSFFGVWLLGGLISLAGAVACAELGTMIPRAGGDYVFQYEAYGPSVAFASGWVLFAAIFCGSIATMTVGLCTYQLPVLLGADLSADLLALPFGMALNGADLAALLLVPALTWLNLMGAQPSARTQAALTIVPIALFALMSVYAIFVYAPLPVHGVAETPSTDANTWSLHGLVVAYMAVYFAYSGWINIIYVAGEVAQPQRNIPFSLIGGTVAVTLLYLLLCAGFLTVLGFGGLPAAGEAGTATAGLLAGQAGRVIITVLIASALLASINGTILGGARVAYAMGRKGAMWSQLGTVEEQHHTPSRALWLQALISCLLIVSGRFEQLYTMVSLAMVVTGTLTVGSVFVLRRRRPNLHRPYRATAYPWLPALYVVSSIAVITVMASRALSGRPDAWYPLLGLGLLIATYLLHRFVLEPRTRQSLDG
jgi:APA family basic amino acid/polyamine antiporter